MGVFPANKLKEGWSKFLDKMRLKNAKREKMKKREQALVVMAMSIQGRPSNETEGSSREGSIRNQQDSDNVRTLHQKEQLCSHHCTIHPVLAFFLIAIQLISKDSAEDSAYVQTVHVLPSIQ